MEGTIIAINNRNGFHAVRTEEGDITVFEMTDTHEATVGDTIAGDLHALGSEQLRNVTQGEEFSAYIQDAFCSDRRAAELLSR